VPAILLVANVDGSQPWTSALALHHAEALARRSGEDGVKHFLERASLIVVPCANPDAHERRFAAVQEERESTGPGVDDDRDGREGEDPPSDVDGDGRVTWMRVPDPGGEWIADPNDARALIRADAKRGERGIWKLWPEGRDLDHDERVAEDAPEDACVNRNFPEQFEELAGRSGRFPMDEPEARALADFVLLHPEIALVVTYGNYDNLVERPKTTQAGARNKLVPEAGVIESDAQLLAELGKRYSEVTGNTAKGRGGDRGTFQAWAYAHRGLWSIAICPWDIPLDAKKAEAKPDEAKPAEGEKPSEPKKEKDARDPSDDAKRLLWLDQNPTESARFVPWHAFTHPELGPVEIGGFAPFARNEPPAAKSGEIAAKELEFLLGLAGELPRVKIAEFSAKKLSDGVFELEARVENDSRLPMQSAAARRAETQRPLRMRLELANGAQLLGGDRLLELERDLGGAGGRIEHRWLVRALSAEAALLRIDTDHAGSDERRAEVKP
jgi:hypothetical protein